MKSNFKTGSAVLIIILLAVSFLLVSAGCRNLNTSETALSADIGVSTRQIASGNVVLGNAVDQPVTVQNTGSGNLVIGSIAQAEPLAPPFSIASDNCSGQSLSPSGTCTFHVRFLPTVEGTFTGTFDIPSNAVNENPVNVSVSGSGEALKVVINQVNTDFCSTGILDLLVSVMTSSNVPITGLGPNNFQLSENGVVQTISSVTPSSTSAPLSVAEVLDYSNSLLDQIPTVVDASGYFIGLMSPVDEAAVFKFATSIQLMQDFTTSQTLLMTAVNTFPTNIGSQDETHLYDALWTVIDATATRQNNRVIILISDGIDEDANNVPNVSVKSLSEVIAHALDTHVAIFTVGLGNANGVVMNQLAGETGGQYFYAPDASQLYDIYKQIRDIVSGQYSMEYATSLSGGGSILFDVIVNSNDGQGEAVRFATECP